MTELQTQHHLSVSCGVISSTCSRQGPRLTQWSNGRAQLYIWKTLKKPKENRRITIKKSLLIPFWDPQCLNPRAILHFLHIVVCVYPSCSRQVALKSIADCNREAVLISLEWSTLLRMINHTDTTLTDYLCNNWRTISLQKERFADLLRLLCLGKLCSVIS